MVDSNSGETNGSGKPLRISDLSRLTGVPVSTLRYWCDQNLLSPNVTATGHRYFEERHVEEAKNILRLRKIQGLSITAVKSTVPQHTPAPIAAEVNNTVGEHLRSLRLRAKLTQRELSQRIGIEQSVLASIERTSLGVNVAEARQLAQYFGVTLTDLMADSNSSSQKPIVTPATGGALQPTLGTGLRIEQMASGHDMMDCQRWYIEPGISSHGSYEHDGEEFIYVLFGQFSISIDNSEPFVLGQGESIYFRSNLKHAWSNPGKTTTILLWVNTPPTF